MPAKHLLVVILLVHIIAIEFKHSFPYIETLYVVQQISVTVVLKTMQDPKTNTIFHTKPLSSEIGHILSSKDQSLLPRHQDGSSQHNFVQGCVPRNKYFMQLYQGSLFFIISVEPYL